jgi:hypothetical protein
MHGQGGVAEAWGRSCLEPGPVYLWPAARTTLIAAPTGWHSLRPGMYVPMNDCYYLLSTAGTFQAKLEDSATEQRTRRYRPAKIRWDVSAHIGGPPGYTQVLKPRTSCQHTLSNRSKLSDKDFTSPASLSQRVDWRFERLKSPPCQESRHTLNAAQNQALSISMPTVQYQESSTPFVDVTKEPFPRLDKESTG